MPASRPWVSMERAVTAEWAVPAQSPTKAVWQARMERLFSGQAPCQDRSWERPRTLFELQAMTSRWMGDGQVQLVSVPHGL